METEPHPLFVAVSKGDLQGIQNEAPNFYRQPEASLYERFETSHSIQRVLPDGMSPLHLAAERCDKNAYAILLHLHKKHTSLADAKGNTPLHYACKFRNVDGGWLK